MCNCHQDCSNFIYLDPTIPLIFDYLDLSFCLSYLAKNDITLHVHFPDSRRRMILILLPYKIEDLIFKPIVNYSIGFDSFHLAVSLCTQPHIKLIKEIVYLTGNVNCFVLFNWTYIFGHVAIDAIAVLDIRPDDLYVMITVLLVTCTMPYF